MCEAISEALLRDYGIDMPAERIWTIDPRGELFPVVDMYKTYVEKRVWVTPEEDRPMTEHELKALRRLVMGGPSAMTEAEQAKLLESLKELK